MHYSISLTVVNNPHKKTAKIRDCGKR